MAATRVRAAQTRAGNGVKVRLVAAKGVKLGRDGGRLAATLPCAAGRRGSFEIGVKTQFAPQIPKGSSKNPLAVLPAESNNPRVMTPTSSSARRADSLGVVAGATWE